MLEKYYQELLRESALYSIERTPNSDDNEKVMRMNNYECSLKLSDGGFIQVKITPMTKDMSLCAVYKNGFDAEEVELRGRKNLYFSKVKKKIKEMDYALFDEDEAKEEFQNYLNKVFLN